MQSKETFVILDFDGTILDSTGAWIGVYEYFCNLYNFNVSDTTAHNQCILDFGEWIDEIITKHQLKHTSKTLTAELSKIATLEYKNIPPRDGFFEFTRSLSSSKSEILIISKEEPDLINAYLKHFSVKGISEVIQDTRQLRSTSDFYFNLSIQYNCSTKDIMQIDDSLKHCIAAKEAGLLAVGMNDNHPIDRQLEMSLACDMYVNDFRDLIIYE